MGSLGYTNFPILMTDQNNCIFFYFWRELREGQSWIQLIWREETHSHAIFFSFMFLAYQRLFLIIFSSVTPHRGQSAVQCHPRWQHTRRLTVSCGLGRRRIQTRDCRTTVRCATTKPPCLPKATMPLMKICRQVIENCLLKLASYKGRFETPVFKKSNLTLIRAAGGVFDFRNFEQV